MPQGSAKIPSRVGIFGPDREKTWLGLKIAGVRKPGLKITGPEPGWKSPGGKTIRWRESLGHKITKSYTFI